MPQHSCRDTHSAHTAKALVRKADQALVEGDRASVTECIGQLYSLFDDQVSPHQPDDSHGLTALLLKREVRQLH